MGAQLNSLVQISCVVGSNRRSLHIGWNSFFYDRVIWGWHLILGNTTVVRPVEERLHLITSAGAHPVAKATVQNKLAGESDSCSRWADGTVNKCSQNYVWCLHGARHPSSFSCSTLVIALPNTLSVSEPTDRSSSYVGLGWGWRCNSSWQLDSITPTKESLWETGSRYDLQPSTLGARVRRQFRIFSFRRAKMVNACSQCKTLASPCCQGLGSSFTCFACSTFGNFLETWKIHTVHLSHLWSHKWHRYQFPCCSVVGSDLWDFLTAVLELPRLKHYKVQHRVYFQLRLNEL